MTTQADVLRAQGHLRDALFDFVRKPTHDDAYRAIDNRIIKGRTVELAELMRLLAIEEDRARRKGKLIPINYREFYVSCVVIGLLPAKGSHRRLDWYPFMSYNTKPTKEIDKFCAEMRGMRALRAVRCQCIGCFAVIGERQADGRSGISRPLGLDPCHSCRDCMRKPENFVMISQKTRVLTGQPGAQIHHVETIPDLMRAHGETWPKRRAVLAA